MHQTSEALTCATLTDYSGYQERAAAHGDAPATVPKLSLDLRAGPYRWITHSDLWIGSAEQLNRNDRGWGYMLGLGPHYVLSEHRAVALNANYFASTTDNRFVQVIASIEYRLR